MKITKFLLLFVMVGVHWLLNTKLMGFDLTLISLAQALLQLLSFWLFHIDSCFSTFCKMCQKFPFVVQCKTWCTQYIHIKIPKATGKCQHLLEAFPIWKPFPFQFRCPLNILSAISPPLFRILLILIMKLSIAAFSN